MKKNLSIMLLVVVLIFNFAMIISFAAPSIDDATGVVTNNGKTIRPGVGGVFLGDDNKYYRVEKDNDGDYVLVDITEEVEKDPSKIDPTAWMEEASDTDPLGTVTDVSKDLGKSGFKLIQTWIRIGASIILSLVAIKWMMSKSGTDVKGAKDWAVNAAVGAVIGFGVNTLLKILFNIATRF